MLKIVQATPDDQAQVRQLFHEHLAGVKAILTREYGVVLDVDAMVDTAMQAMPLFLPPDGRLILAYSGDALAGCAGLRTLSPAIGELKRMYVRPACRRQGIGGALIDALVAESRRMGIRAVRLDTSQHMTEAQALYRSKGFRERPPYDESDVPKQVHPYTVFMELSLDAASAS
jgi:ribosomal protein S18 acetylase RimI-like enzyme